METSPHRRQPTRGNVSQGKLKNTGRGKRKKENRQPKRQGAREEHLEGWEQAEDDGTPPPKRDFKERSVMR